VVAAPALGQGRLYEGHKVVPYCPRCGTALSSHEVALGYKDVEDPSIYVQFELLGEAGPAIRESLLVWTTTPWTLPGNVAVAGRA
jgi:isoleucyl-tRNA synthetase